MWKDSLYKIWSDIVCLGRPYDLCIEIWNFKLKSPRIWWRAFPNASFGGLFLSSLWSLCTKRNSHFKTLCILWFLFFPKKRNFLCEFETERMKFHPEVSFTLAKREVAFKVVHRLLCFSRVMYVVSSEKLSFWSV